MSSVLFVKKTSDDETRKGSAAMIRKVYEVDPLLCLQRGDRIIDHLGLVFVAAKPPPPRIADQEFLTAAETSGEYFS